MRRKALLSVMTLYHHDNTIFDDMRIPSGPSVNEKVEYRSIFTPDKEVLKAAILLECAELEVLLPDPDALKSALYYWSRQRFPIWQKLLDTCLFLYNPIWNVDGDIQIDRAGDLSSTKNGTTSDQYSKSGRRDLDREEIDQVSAFDSSGWSNAAKRTTDEGEPWSESGSASGTSRDTETGEHSDTEHTRRTGNIGVTMTQDMIIKERETALYDWYDQIVRDFKQKFCLGVY